MAPEGSRALLPREATSRSLRPGRRPSPDRSWQPRLWDFQPQKLFASSSYALSCDGGLSGITDRAKQRAAFTRDSGEHRGSGLEGPQTQQDLGTSRPSAGVGGGLGYSGEAGFERPMVRKTIRQLTTMADFSGTRLSPTGSSSEASSLKLLVTDQLSTFTTSSQFCLGHRTIGLVLRG